MASLSSFGSAVFIISILAFSSSSMVAFASNFWQDFDLTWGGRRAQILNDGQLLTLSLDRVSGSALQSKNAYLYGKIDMQMKLVPGNSAGTVTAYYMRADTVWDEIDFEFLGNLSGDPYTLHTNIYTDGQGGREQQFRLWFDPSADFHTYSVFWSPECIIHYVDETPIRVFGNLESSGVPFPKKQAMKIYSSIWNGDEWATRGGAVKIDWSQAPFTSSYRNFSARSCILSSLASSCAATSISQVLDPASQRMLRWVRNNHMIYDYCADTKRFPQGPPPECTVTGL